MPLSNSIRNKKTFEIYEISRIRNFVNTLVETEENSDAMSTNERGHFLVVGLVVPVKETFILPWLFWSAQ